MGLKILTFYSRSEWPRIAVTSEGANAKPKLAVVPGLTDVWKWLY
jgi:hypothetical protein